MKTIAALLLVVASLPLLGQELAPVPTDSASYARIKLAGIELEESAKWGRIAGGSVLIGGGVAALVGAFTDVRNAIPIAVASLSIGTVGLFKAIGSKQKAGRLLNGHSE